MLIPPKKQSGFTIIELLIVIVIIAILATITLVSYNGIQQRASNAQTLNAAEAYIKGLIMYAAQNGAYPPASGVCLGQGYPGGKCWNNAYSENATLADQLRTVMGQQLPLAAFLTANGTSSYGGIIYAYYTIDSGGPYPAIAYMLTGAGSTCSVGTTFTYHDSSLSTSTPNPNPAGSHPQCFVRLPAV